MDIVCVCIGKGGTIVCPLTVGIIGAVPSVADNTRPAFGAHVGGLILFDMLLLAKPSLNMESHRGWHHFRLIQIDSAFACRTRNAELTLLGLNSKLREVCIKLFYCSTTCTFSFFG